MRRLSRAAALTAVSLALAVTPSACKKKNEGQKTAEATTEPKQADPPASAPALPAAPSAPAAGDPAAPNQPTPPAPTVAAPTAPEPEERPSSISDDHVATADRVVDATNKFADDLEAVKGDCKKATEVVKAGAAAMRAAMENTETLQAQLHRDPKAMQWFQQTYAPRMSGAIAKLGDVWTQCGNEKEFEDAFKTLELSGSDKAAPKP